MYKEKRLFFVFLPPVTCERIYHFTEVLNLCGETDSADAFDHLG